MLTANVSKLNLKNQPWSNPSDGLCLSKTDLNRFLEKRGSPTHQRVLKQEESVKLTNFKKLCVPAFELFSLPKSKLCS